MDTNQIHKLIATNILGWEFLEVGYFGDESETKRQVELEEWMDENNLNSIGNYFIDVKKNFWIHTHEFSPTTNMIHAWMVAEKLFITICPQKGAPKELSFHADIYNDPTDNYYEAYAETAPLAICKVALKSIGVNLSIFE